MSVLEGAEPGKNLVIMAGVHGNEPCGVNAFERLLPELVISRGRVTFVLGNPRAIERNVRFTEANLNRLFRPDNELPEAAKATYEYRRSRELLPLLEAADAVLDVHSSGTEDTLPFAICSARSLGTAQQLGFPIVSYGWDAIEPGGTDDYAERFGAEGICIECGYHEDPLTVDRAIDAIRRFLAIQGAYELPTSDARLPMKTVRVESIYKTTIGFAPTKVFNDFEPVMKGLCIGMDGSVRIKAPDDGLVVFVRERSGPNEEAFIFGRYV